METINSEDVIKVNNLPSGWKSVLSEDKIWINYYPENLEIDEQGWKLHISCSYRDAFKMQYQSSKNYLNDQVKSMG